MGYFTTFSSSYHGWDLCAVPVQRRSLKTGGTVWGPPDTISTRARRKMTKSEGKHWGAKSCTDLGRCIVSNSFEKRREHPGNGLLIRAFRVRFPGDPLHWTWSAW